MALWQEIRIRLMKNELGSETDVKNHLWMYVFVKKARIRFVHSDSGSKSRTRKEYVALIFPFGSGSDLF